MLLACFCFVCTLIAFARSFAIRRCYNILVAAISLLIIVASRFYKPHFVVDDLVLIVLTVYIISAETTTTICTHTAVMLTISNVINRLRNCKMELLSLCSITFDQEHKC
jgi:hypothetical protein